MIEQTVRHIYSMLCSKRYKDIVKFTKGVRLSADEIEQCISEYGRKLMPYPAYIDLDIIEVIDSKPREFSVIAPIYTLEEGVSDLSLELSLTDNAESLYQSELDNIRVR